MTRSRLIPLALAGALVLGGCSSAGDDAGLAGGPSPDSPSATAGDPTSSESPASPESFEPVAASEEWAHVHNLTVDGDLLLIGTHGGLWSQRPGQPAQRVSEQAFDVMGFAQAGETMYASGHPAAGQDAPPDLGLQVSDDGGRRWQSKSLLGEVDFHRLRAQGAVVQGLSAHDGAFLRSSDKGATWRNLGSPGFFDFALNPGDPQSVIATQQSGPVRSSDGGTTFEPIPGAPLLAFLAWTADAIYAIAADNTIQVSTDEGTTWTDVGQLDGQPQALGADGKRVVALAGTTIWDSTDGGRTFVPRITGLDGH